MIQNDNRITFQQILRASLVAVSATAVNTVAGIVRAKGLALLLGPPGIGLLSLLSALFSTGSAVACLGINFSGVRQVAIDRENPELLSQTRRALFFGLVCLGGIAALCLWMLSAPIAEAVLDARDKAKYIRWLGFGLLMNSVVAYQNSVLQGLNRIRDLSFVTAGAAVAGVLIGLLSIYLFHEMGVVILVLASPLSSLLIGAFLVGRLGLRTVGKMRSRKLIQQIRGLASLGIASMAVSVLNGCVLIGARSTVTHDLGIAGAGQFAAAWGVPALLAGFLISAMELDYYPRLASVVAEPVVARNLIDRQLELALLAATPALVLAISLMHVLLPILYSADFAGAVSTARWFCVGYLLKVFSWPLVYVLLVQNRSKVFFLLELGWNLLFLTALKFGIGWIGLSGCGVAFCASYGIYAIVLVWLVKKYLAYRLTHRLVILLVLSMLGSGGVFLLSFFSSPNVAAISGTLVTIIVCVVSFKRIRDCITAENRIFAAESH